ncbi:MAG TPA: dTDP-4-dehydrorhamnose 3,5-epimerase [Pseudorhodoplanes sp.]|nr:dTDP-4-dehydrorhamnose 3,5-epimerase [Pseudorhodoplanes sp.]
MRALALPGAAVISGPCFQDARGFFSETYRKRDFAALGVDVDFVQENWSMSEVAGTIRGLHFQAPPHAQAKLLQVLRGAIFDALVDLRRGSPTFGQWCGITLRSGAAECLYVPEGFAHGFCTLENDTLIAYKVSAYYDQASEGGVIWNDPDLRIEWPIAAEAARLSEKDRRLPRLADLTSPFGYAA